MFKEFRDFAMRGNVIDMAIGIIIGVAFNSIVQSLVKDIIMPPIGLLIRNVDFSNLFIVLRGGTPGASYVTLAEAQQAGAVSLNYGPFINTIISYIIIAFAVFLLVKGINRIKKREEKLPAKPTTKKCPYCFSNIPIKAKRCAFCTSTLEE